MPAELRWHCEDGDYVLLADDRRVMGIVQAAPGRPGKWRLLLPSGLTTEPEALENVQAALLLAAEHLLAQGVPLSARQKRIRRLVGGSVGGRKRKKAKAAFAEADAVAPTAPVNSAESTANGFDPTTLSSATASVRKLKPPPPQAKKVHIPPALAQTKARPTVHGHNRS